MTATSTLSTTAGVEQRAEQFSAAEQPDVFAGPLLEGGDAAGIVVGDHDALVRRRRQGFREHDDLETGHRTRAAVGGHHLVRLAPISAVSNGLYSALKSIAGSITIQSFSPRGRR